MPRNLDILSMKMSTPRLEARRGLLPLLMGASTAIALLVELVIPPWRSIPFLLIALACALPVGTLQLRDGRVRWLGARRSVVCCASVLGAGLPFVMIVVLNPFRPYAWAFQFPPEVDLVTMSTFVALEALLSAWLAMSLRGWADGGSALDRERAGRDSRSLGPAGKIGGVLVLTGLAGVTWTSMFLPFATGRAIDFVWGSRFEMSILTLVGVGGLIAEAVRRYASRR